MKREEALKKLKEIAVDLDEKAGNVLCEGRALQELAGNLERAANMLGNGEDGYIYLQIGENTLGNTCHIDMRELGDIEASLDKVKEFLYGEAE